MCELLLLAQGKDAAAHWPGTGAAAAAAKNMTADAKAAVRAQIVQNHEDGHDTMKTVVKEALAAMRSMTVDNPKVQNHFFSKLGNIKHHMDEARARQEATEAWCAAQPDTLPDTLPELLADGSANPEAGQPHPDAGKPNPDKAWPGLDRDGIIVRGAELVNEILRGNKGLCDQVPESLVHTFASLLNGNSESKLVTVFLEFFFIIARPDPDAPALEENQYMSLQALTSTETPHILDQVYLRQASAATPSDPLRLVVCPLTLLLRASCALFRPARVGLIFPGPSLRAARSTGSRAGRWMGATPSRAASAAS